MHGLRPAILTSVSRNPPSEPGRRTAAGTRRAGPTGTAGAGRAGAGTGRAGGGTGRAGTEPVSLTERQGKPPDLIVILPLKDWTCAGCGGTGDLLTMEDAGPLCLSCTDMDHLIFIPSGDAALTRRTRQASSLSAVVVRWSRSRKRYERQGILAEEPALVQAEERCLADEEARLRRRERDRERRAGEDVKFQSRMAEEIIRLFPGCPGDRAAAIARHAGLRGSGRVGRSAAGRALDEEAITLAVVASVRHEDTSYDSLLMSGVPRAAAREQVRGAIDRVLADWVS